MFNNPRRSTVLFCVMLILMVGFVEFLRPNTDHNQVKSTTDKSNVQNSKAHVLNTFFIEKTPNKNGVQTVNYMHDDIDISDAKVTKKYDEITDLNLLFKNAKKIKKEILKGKNIKTGKEEDEEVLEVDYYQTSQLLEELEKPDGQKIEKYAITYFTVAKEKNNTEEELQPTNESNLNVITLSNNNSNINFQKTGSKYDYQWDPTGGVKAYSTIYVNKTTDSQGTWLDLQSVTGGWEIHDNTYYLTNMRVRLAQIGVGTNGSVYKTLDKYPSSLTWSYSAPPEWPKVSANTTGAGQAYVGAGQYTRINRGSTYWQFDWANNW
jgi:hypothetical protein